MTTATNDAPRLHSICIVDGFELPSSLPELVRENIESFRTAHARSEHTLWSGNALRAFIADHYEPAVLAAFELMRPYSFKCDLARLCVLHHFGGIYADLGLRFRMPLRPPETMGFVAYRSLPFLTSNWTTMSNGLLFAHAGRRECRIAIDSIVENCRSRHYGDHPLCVSGPALLGQSVAAAMVERGVQRAPDQWIGLVVAQGGEPGELGYLSPDRQIVALNVKRGRSLPEMGVAGTNGYIQPWNDRTVYGDAATD